MSLTKVTDSMRDAIVFNALDYGADNTGLTDSAPAIQAAIDDAGARGKVVIPAGKYLLKNAINLKIGSYVEGVAGGVSEESVSGFSEGTTLYLDTTLSDGSAWTTTEVNDNGDTYAGRIMFSATQAGGACVLRDMLCYDLGGSANNSTFLYCGSEVDTVPYERGRVTQFHGIGLRLFTFDRGFFGGKFTDAWLTDCHSEQVTTVFLGALNDNSNDWNVHMTNCLWWRSAVHFSMQANVSVSIFASNCTFTGSNASTSQFISNGASGTAEWNFWFSNCNIANARIPLRDASNVGGNLYLQITGSRLANVETNEADEGSSRIDKFVLNGCLLDNSPIFLRSRSANRQIVNCAFDGSTSKITLLGGGPTIIANNDFNLTTTSAPLVDFGTGVVTDNVLIANNVFKTASDVGGSSFRNAIQDRVRLIGNSYVPDEEVSPKTPFTTASAFEILGSTVASNKVDNSDLHFVLRNSSSLVEDVRLLSDIVSDANSSLTIQTSISHTVADRLKIDSSGNLLPGANNAYSLGDGSTRWTEVFATNGTINTSDQRHKNNISESCLGLDFVKDLEPMQFTMVEGGTEISSRILQDAVYDEYGVMQQQPVYEQVYTPRSGTRTHFGLLAQQVKSVIPDGLDFAGWILSNPDDPDSDQGLRYHEFIAPMIKAIQELSAKNDALEQRIQQLEGN